MACTDHEEKHVVVFYLNDPTNERWYGYQQHLISKTAISPNNEYLVGYGKEFGMIVWNLKDKIVKHLTMDVKVIRSLVFSNDSMELITSDKTIKVWDCSSWEVS